jgi:hypothetical protein
MADAALVVLHLVLTQVRRHAPLASLQRRRGDRRVELRRAGIVHGGLATVGLPPGIRLCNQPAGVVSTVPIVKGLAILHLESCVLCSDAADTTHSVLGGRKINLEECPDNTRLQMA